MPTRGVVESVELVEGVRIVEGVETVRDGQTWKNYLLCMETIL